MTPACYLTHVKAWFNAHSVVYQTYWNSNSDCPGQLSEEKYPHARVAYRKLFGKG